MKKHINNFKNSFKYSVSIIASREFAFIYCLLGTIGQIAHTYYLMNNISSLDGGWKVTQAIMLSVFISSSLLYFTAISDNADTKESKRIHFAVTLFTIIEILINIYYYSRHLILERLNTQQELGNYIFDFIFAILISCLIPVTIKLYSSHIRAKEWLEEIDNEGKEDINESITNTEDFVTRSEFVELENDVDKLLEKEFSIEELVSEVLNSTKFNEYFSSTQSGDNSAVSIDINEVTKKVSELLPKPEAAKINQVEMEEIVSKILSTKMTDIDNQITDSFEKNSSLFLQQYKNKIQNVNKIASES